jgi:hypothetical protein
MNVTRGRGRDLQLQFGSGFLDLLMREDRAGDRTQNEARP